MVGYYTFTHCESVSQMNPNFKPKLNDFILLLIRTTVAALCSAHGQCDQIFAKVGDGRLHQRKPAGHFEKNDPNLGKPCFSTHQLEVKYVVGKQILKQ